jgi:hypothetical protein
MRFEMRPSPWVAFAAQRTGGQSTKSRAYGFLGWERGL